MYYIMNFTYYYIHISKCYKKKINKLLPKNIFLSGCDVTNKTYLHGKSD